MNQYFQPKYILAVVAVFLFSLASFFGWKNYQTKKNQEASISFYKITDLKDQTPEKTVESWNEFLQKFSSTSLAPSARLFKAKALMDLSKYEEAIKEYTLAAKALPKPHTYLALEGTALAYMNLTKWTEAEKIWQDLTSKNDNHMKEFHFWNYGITLEKLSKKQEAIQVFQRFETEFKDSPFLEKAKFKLAQLQTQL